MRKTTRPAAYGPPMLHTAQRSRSRGMSLASDADGVDSPALRKTPPPVKTASPARANGRTSPKGGSFDKQTSRPEFISYANVTKAAPSGILPTPPKRHSNSRLSLGSDTEGIAMSPSRAVARTPTSNTSGAVDSSLPLTPTAGPTVSDISEQPQQV